ncbi:hypothetical protein K470DRAFT_148991 [Piedraia hortae CBS 480.64]|uniref:Uncharacterized protein n=1 Tax=Piedraia hortae CBS 480.64 TaxID=1314780 RepID=A0A6A7BT78_9PEZI|nr:hypothetical protein K470DRAFT_148991 [Piedraia hortae CBS 480.64]
MKDWVNGPNIIHVWQKMAINRASLFQFSSGVLSTWLNCDTLMVIAVTPFTSSHFRFKHADLPLPVHSIRLPSYESSTAYIIAKESRPALHVLAIRVDYSCTMEPPTTRQEEGRVIPNPRRSKSSSSGEEIAQLTTLLNCIDVKRAGVEEVRKNIQARLLIAERELRQERRERRVQ